MPAKAVTRTQLHHAKGHDPRQLLAQAVEIEVETFLATVKDLNLKLKEIAAWQKRRNKTRARIKWMFTTDRARVKLGRAYPATAKESKSL